MITPWLTNLLITGLSVEAAKSLGQAIFGGDDNSSAPTINEVIDGPSAPEDVSPINRTSTSSTPSASSTSSTSSTGSSSSYSASSSAYTQSPEVSDIAKIYEVLAPMSGDYMNAQAEQIGQAQRSMGTLAGKTMGATTSGLGNYTYNRLMRPQADTMRDELLVKGYTTQLNQLLSNALKNAQRRYNSGNNGGDNGTPSGDNNATGVTQIGGTDTESILSDPAVNRIPNSYEYEDADGIWHRVYRTTENDDLWILRYESARSNAAKEGRKFNG